MQFKDIREHLPDGCPKNGTWFRVRNKPQDGQKLTRSEVWLKARINFADWVRAQPSPEVCTARGLRAERYTHELHTDDRLWGYRGRQRRAELYSLSSVVHRRVFVG